MVFEIDDKTGLITFISTEQICVSIGRNFVKVFGYYGYITTENLNTNEKRKAALEEAIKMINDGRIGAMRSDNDSNAL